MAGNVPRSPSKVTVVLAQTWLEKAQPPVKKYLVLVPQTRREGPQLLLNIIAVSGLLIVTQTLTAVAHLAVWLYVTPPALLHPPLHKSSSSLHERDDGERRQVS